MGRSRHVVAIVFVLTGLLLGIPRIAHAQNVTGSLDVLTFPGADSTNCGSLRVLGQVIVSAPSDFIAVATDASGNVIHGVTGTIGGDTFPRTFSSYGGVFQQPPRQNAVHLVVVIDGVKVADVTANDPCLGLEAI